jgi:hypothetical protein
VLLFINIFVLNSLSDFGILRRFFLREFLFSLILITGVMAVAKSRFVTVPAALVALATLLVRWTETFVPGTSVAILDALLSLVFLGMLIVVVILQVFREGPITVHRIMGAVVVYLLLGLMWAFAYKLVALYQPESFNIVHTPVPGQDYDSMERFIYFSYITLTTLGYGDITAVTPVARSLAMLEALIGQLFPAILIARLVSMELFYRRSK